MADPLLTRAQKLANLQSEGQVLRTIIPEIPYTPPPPQLLGRVPEFGQWYQAFYESMMQWREHLNQELSRS